MYHGCNWYILLGVCLWYIFSFFYVVFYTANFSSYNYNPKCWTSRFYSFATTDVWAFLVPQTVKNWPTMQETWFDPWFGKIPWRKEWLTMPVFWPGEFHGQRNLAVYSQWGCEESDMTEWLSLHFTLNGLLVFPTFFNLSLNFVIRSSWSEPQSIQGLVLLTV